MTTRARVASLQTYAPIAGRRSPGIGVGGSIARPIVREKTFTTRHDRPLVSQRMEGGGCVGVKKHAHSDGRT